MGYLYLKWKTSLKIWDLKSMNGHYELNNDITILDSYNPSNRGGTIIVKIELSLIEILLIILIIRYVL